MQCVQLVLLHCVDWWEFFNHVLVLICAPRSLMLGLGPPASFP